MRMREGGREGGRERERRIETGMEGGKEGGRERREIFQWHRPHPWPVVQFCVRQLSPTHPVGPSCAGHSRE